jgi:hypothetical protein
VVAQFDTTAVYSQLDSYPVELGDRRQVGVQPLLMGSAARDSSMQSDWQPPPVAVA